MQAPELLIIRYIARHSFIYNKNHQNHDVTWLRRALYRRLARILNTTFNGQRRQELLRVLRRRRCVGKTISILWTELRNSYQRIQRALHSGEMVLGNLTTRNRELLAELDFLQPFTHHRDENIRNMAYHDFLEAFADNNDDAWNNAQLELLISIMEEHTWLAKIQITKMGPQGNDFSDELWRNAAIRLNTIGTAKFSMDKWKELWDRLKSKAKAKMAEYLKNQAQTGNVPNNVNLDKLTKRICAIFGGYGTGLAIKPEFGVNRPKPKKSI